MLHVELKFTNVSGQSNSVFWNNHYGKDKPTMTHPNRTHVMFDLKEISTNNTGYQSMQLHTNCATLKRRTLDRKAASRSFLATGRLSCLSSRWMQNSSSDLLCVFLFRWEFSESGHVNLQMRLKGEHFEWICAVDHYWTKNVLCIVLRTFSGVI